MTLGVKDKRRLTSLSGLLNDKVGDECLNSSLTFDSSVFSTMTWKQVIAAYLRLIKLKAAPREVSTYGHQINQSR